MTDRIETEALRAPQRDLISRAAAIAEIERLLPHYGDFTPHDRGRVQMLEHMRDFLRALAVVDMGNPIMGEPVTLTYRNWRGEVSERTITPKRIWFGATDWHPEPQWLLAAWDAEKGAERDFALKDFGQPAGPAVKAKPQDLSAVREEAQAEIDRLHAEVERLTKAKAAPAVSYWRNKAQTAFEAAAHEAEVRGAVGAADAIRALKLPDAAPVDASWTNEAPIKGGYYWFVGVPFYAPVIARVNEGVRSRREGERRIPYPELNVQLFAEGYGSILWKSDGWQQGQWFGPIPIPTGHDEVIHPVEADRIRRMQEGGDA